VEVFFLDVPYSLRNANPRSAHSGARTLREPQFFADEVDDRPSDRRFVFEEATACLSGSILCALIIFQITHNAFRQENTPVVISFDFQTIFLQIPRLCHKTSPWHRQH
jgi:hypothetical protein